MRIADGNGCEPARMVHDVPGTVANRRTSFSLANLQDSSPQSNDLTHRVRGGGLGVDTVKGGTGTNKVEVKPAAEEDSGRSGQARRWSAEVPTEGGKACTLEIVQRMRRLVGAGEMADESPPPDRAFLRELIGEPFKLPRGQAETCHPRIHLQHRGQSAVSARSLYPVRDLSGLIEDGNELVKDELFRRFW